MVIDSLASLGREENAGIERSLFEMAVLEPSNEVLEVLVSAWQQGEQRCADDSRKTHSTASMPEIGSHQLCMEDSLLVLP